MGRISSRGAALFAAVLILFFGGIGLAKGGLYVTRHEGDTAHLVEIVLRMLDGQVPHLDFSTPIGVLAFLPVVALAKTGLGVGMAFLAAQVLAAGLMLPVVARVAASRLSGAVAWAYVLIAMGLMLALVHGGAALVLSPSMYYNRWAWSAAFAAVLLAVMPPKDGAARPRLDGLFLGLLMGFLALSKPTFFIALALPVTLALLTRRAWREVGFALIGGALVAMAVSALYGVGFLPAFASDLLSVTRSATRSAPGAGLATLVSSPTGLVGTLTLLAGIVVLRQSGQGRAGGLLLLLAPAFYYITYQNFGNDPQWLLLVAIYLAAHRADMGQRALFEADARHALAGLALVALALGAPSLQTLLTSPLRHFGAPEASYVPYFADRPEAGDIHVLPLRMMFPVGQSALVETTPALEGVIDPKAYAAPTTFLGESLPRCRLIAGDLALHRAMVAELRAAPLSLSDASQIYVADIAPALWILGGFTALKGGAPWYYSGTPGVENADAIVVPLCPLDADVARQMLSALEGAGLTLRPPVKTDLMWVYPVAK